MPLFCFVILQSFINYTSQCKVPYSKLCDVLLGKGQTERTIDVMGDLKFKPCMRMIYQQMPLLTAVEHFFKGVHLVSHKETQSCRILNHS